MDGGEHEGQHGLQAGHAGRRMLAFFFGDGVRGVVGGDAVHHVQVGPQRVAVGGGAQGGFHVPERPQSLRVGFGEEQVMRRDLAGDGRAALFRRVDERDFGGATHVAEVHWLIVGLGQSDDPGQGQSLGVDGDRAASGPLAEVRHHRR